jgi:hypothetical protein
MIEFYFPTSPGEWAAFGSACLTVLLGLARLVYLLGFRTAGPSMIAQAQAAGFLIGTAAICLLMAQPLIYLGLGAAWALSALFSLASAVRHGRAVSGGARSAILHFVVAALLGALPLGYVFGFL